MVIHCKSLTKLSNTRISFIFSCNIKDIDKPGKVYDDLMSIIVRLASYGLIHSDFNEFNLMISDEGKVTMIDFPQMVSISHLNAEYYFDRDVQCIRDFFRRRFEFETENYPKFADIKRVYSLDNDVRASGFSKELEKQFEDVSETLGLRQDLDKDEQYSSEEEEEDDEEEISSEEEEEEVAPQNEQITKLTKLIDTNHLLPIEEPNENRAFKPFHDAKEEEEESEEEIDETDKQSMVSTTDKLSSLNIDKDYVRAKVKQSLKKKLKQQHRRLCTKGEAALVTAKRRDQRETIQLHLE